MKLRTTCGMVAASVAMLGLLGTVALAPAPSHAKKEARQRTKPLRVAILPIINSSPELSATKIMDDVIREQLGEMPKERGVFLYPFDTEQRLTSMNELDRAYRLNDQWAKYGTIDSTAMAGLDSILLVDAVLFARVSEWENHRVPVIGAGSSHTTVGFSFACYDVRSMKRIWKKTPREQRFGQEIDPTSGTVNYDETGFIQNRRASDPPRYEAVAADLVRDAFKKFPEK